MEANYDSGDATVGGAQPQIDPVLPIAEVRPSNNTKKVRFDKSSVNDNHPNSPLGKG